MDLHMLGHVADLLIVGLIFGAPVWAVARLRGWGVVVGALVAWYLSVLQIDLRVAMHPWEDHALSRAFGIMFGWLGALVYALVIYAIVLGVGRHREERERKRAAVSPGQEAGFRWRVADEELEPSQQQQAESPLSDTAANCRSQQNGS
jgi:hypothetical protein